MAKKTVESDGPAIDGAFLNLLQNHRRGEVLSDLADAVREVTEAVRATGKGGKISFTLKIRQAAKSGAMVVEDEVKTTLPKSEAEGSIFFADDAGNLLREDPNQRQLPLRTVAGGQEPEEPLKTLAAS